MVLVIKKHHARVLLSNYCRMRKVMSEFPLSWFNIEAFRTIPIVGVQFNSHPILAPNLIDVGVSASTKRYANLPCSRHSFATLRLGIGQLTRKEASRLEKVGKAVNRPLTSLGCCSPVPNSSTHPPGPWCPLFPNTSDRLCRRGS